MSNERNKRPLSCFIIAKNEEERIARTIRSVLGLVDEVIVIDSGSTDRTEEICRSLDVKFISNTWGGFGPQKRFGEDQCTHDWVLNLDADEVVTPALREEIAQVLEGKLNEVAGYHLRVVDILPGKSHPLPLARKYNIVRFYDKQKIRYSDSPVHDRVEVKKQPLGQLAHLVYHHSYLSISHTVLKTNRYSDLQAETITNKKLWQLKLRLVSEFPVSFMRYYFLRGYFMAGSQGFIYSMINSSYRFNRIAKMIEAQDKKFHEPD